jgi:hypothetical protein
MKRIRYLKNVYTYIVQIANNEIRITLTLVINNIKHERYKSF